MGIVAFTTVHLGGYGARARTMFPRSLIAVAEVRFRDSSSAPLSDSDLVLASPSDELRSLVAKSDGARCIIAVGSVGVKGVIVKGRSLRAGVVFDLRVMAEGRRLGLGRRLTELLERFAWDEGAALVYLSVNRDNVAANALYERVGYSLCSDRSMVMWIAPAAGAPMTMAISAFQCGVNERSAAKALDALGVPRVPADATVDVRQVGTDEAWRALEAAWWPEAGGAWPHEDASAGAVFGAAPATDEDVAWVRSAACPPVVALPASGADGAAAGKTGGPVTAGDSPTTAPAPPDGAPNMAPLAWKSILSGPLGLGTFVAEATGAGGEPLGRAQISIVDGSAFGGMMLVRAFGVDGGTWSSTPCRLAVWGVAAAIAAGTGAWLAGTGVGAGASGTALSVGVWSVWAVGALLSLGMAGLITSAASAIASPSGAFDGAGRARGDCHHRVRLVSPHWEGPLGPRLLTMAARAAATEAGRLGFTLAMGNFAAGHPMGAALNATGFGARFMWKAKGLPGCAPIDGCLPPFDLFDPRDL